MFRVRKPGAVMPRGRGRPKKAKTEVVRVGADVRVMAEAVADSEGVSVPDLLTSLLLGPLGERFQKILPGLRAMAKTSDKAKERLDGILAAIAEAQAARRETPPAK